MNKTFCRFLSLLMIASMLFSLSCEAFANTTIIDDSDIPPGAGDETGPSGVDYPTHADNVLILPAGLEEIGEEAFYGNTSIDEVILPEGIREIGPRAFLNSSLKRINLPASLTEISNTAFGEPGSIFFTAAKGTFACSWALEKGYIHDYSNLTVLANGYPIDDYWTQNTFTFIDYYLPVNSSIELSVLPPENDTDLHFQWEINNTPLTNATENSYSLNVDFFTVLACTVSDPIGYSWRYVIELHPDTSLYAYSGNYSNKLVGEIGENINLSVIAYCNVPISYRWERESPTTGTFEVITGETTPALDVEVMESGTNYRCVVTDEYGNFVGVHFSIYPDPHMQIHIVGDTYRAVIPGSREELAVEVECDEEVYYQWYFYQYDPEFDSYYSQEIPDVTPSIITYPIENYVYYYCIVSVASGYSTEIFFELYADESLIQGPDNVVYRDRGGTMEIARYQGDASVLIIPETVNSLPVTAVGRAAFASNKTLTSLYLPKTILSIEWQAFSSVQALEQFVIPYGTQSIEGEVFANSSLQIIYIPDTVEYIADNAFSGTEDIIIRTPSGTYAEAYAEEFDYYTESAGSQYSADILTEDEIGYHEIQQEKLDGSLRLDIESLSAIATDGIMDPEIIVATEELNTLIEGLNARDIALGENYNELTEAIEGMATLADLYKLSYDNNSMAVTLGDSTFSFYSNGMDDFGDNFEILSSEASENGDLRMVVESNGSQYLVESSSGTITLSHFSGNRKTTGREKVVFAAAYPSETQVNAFVDWVTSNIDGIAASYLAISAAALSFKEALLDDIQNYNNLKATIQADIRIIINSPYDPPVPLNEALKPYEDALAACEKKIALYNKALSGLEKALKFLKKHNPAIVAATIVSDSIKFQQVCDLESHGHPLDYERSDEKTLALVNEMLSHIKVAKRAYGGKIVLNAFDLVNDCSTAVAIIGSLTVEGAPVAWLQKIMTSAACFVGKKATLVFMAKFFANIAVDIAAESHKNEAFDLDNILHQSAAGYVYNETTKQPIRNVMVSCNGVTTHTDSQGFYRLGVPNGTHTLHFSKKGYKDVEEPVTIQFGMSTFNKVYMTSKSIIRGKVTDALTGKPISNATVLYGYYKTRTNSAGIYSFEVVPGTETLKASAFGYISSREIMATCEANMTKEYNITLTKEENDIQVNGYWDIRVDGLTTAAKLRLPISADGTITLKISSSALVSYWCSTSNIGVYDSESGKIVGYITHILDWSDGATQLAYTGNVKKGQILSFTLPKITKNTAEWGSDNLLCWYINSSFVPANTN